ncbi:uncharacterized protein LOC115390074 isoform X3 [Salarias fasciatus]|uniref:uncharacterized protein LOC115390073 isoform X3 n=1 Tax=Salarias fasciatus TaxID=181472 RepID=UPI0011764E7C|nr:uncharacterized protein LOC115390073 isoform X3 [Salarias fasciatus]XP_029949605.1 uncharacterized protein LOC115390074 isoform X3 [Salarias fasciatus]
MTAPPGLPMSSEFPHYSFKMPNIGFQNLPLNIYIVVFGTAIFVFILSLLFCCYLIRQQEAAVLPQISSRHPDKSYPAGQTIPLTLLREVKVTCIGGKSYKPMKFSYLSLWSMFLTYFYVCFFLSLSI